MSTQTQPDLSFFPHREINPITVDITPTVTLSGEISGLVELADDPVDGTLGDPDLIADFAEANARVVRDAEEHLGVVAEEGPPGHGQSLSTVLELRF